MKVATGLAIGAQANSTAFAASSGLACAPMAKPVATFMMKPLQKYFLRRVAALRGARNLAV